MEATLSVRLASDRDFAELERRLAESGFDPCDFQQTPCMVAERGGDLVGMLPIRLLINPVPIWQGEPLLVFCEPTMTRRRVMYLLWKAAERWISSELNQTGIKRYLAITYVDSVKSLFAHGGLTRLAEPEAKFFQHLSADVGAEFFFRQL